MSLYHIHVLFKKQLRSTTVNSLHYQKIKLSVELINNDIGIIVLSFCTSGHKYYLKCLQDFISNFAVNLSVPTKLKTKNEQTSEIGPLLGMIKHSISRVHNTGSNQVSHMLKLLIERNKSTISNRNVTEDITMMILMLDY